MAHRTRKQRYRRSLKLYRQRASNARLRALLKAKGRLGWFDPRMCAYNGVAYDISKGCKKAIARGYGAGLVPTSTTGGTHAPGSYHGQHRAVDLGVRRELIGTQKAFKRLARFQRAEFRRRQRRQITPIELIGPDNSKIVLRGSATSLAEGSALEDAHDNHVHEAY